jgi:hypothetical protein
MNTMGAADGLRSSLRQSEVADLTLPHEFGHGTDGLLDRHLRIDPVLVVQVDDINFQPPQTGLTGLMHVFRPAIHALTRLGPHLPELGSENRLVATTGDGPSDQLLVLPPTVHVGRIEQCHALVEGIADE